MTFYRFITSLKRYGLKGVRDWTVRKLHPTDDKLALALKNSIGPNPPVRGITIIGDLSSHNSLSKVLRDLAKSLDEADVPHQAFDTTKAAPEGFIANRYTDVITMFGDIVLAELAPCRIHRIVFWEFDTGFAPCYPQCIDGAPLLALSEYCRETVREQIRQKNRVEYLLYPFHFDSKSMAGQKAIRNKFSIPENDFMVFFNFDYRSSYYRKNPEGLLQAFLRAFKPTDHAVLVFKTIGSRAKPEMATRLRREISANGAERMVVFIDDYISDEDLVSLTAACDVYASLHRGEGFGLGIAEAMCMGKAVVASDCGSTNEFCHRDTAELVPHRIVAVPPEQIDHPAYTWVGQWPDPDIPSAARALRKLYDDPTYRMELGERAQTFIREHYGIENFKKSLNAFLEQQS